MADKDQRRAQPHIVRPPQRGRYASPARVLAHPSDALERDVVRHLRLEEDEAECSSSSSRVMVSRRLPAFWVMRPLA